VKKKTFVLLSEEGSRDTILESDGDRHTKKAPLLFLSLAYHRARGKDDTKNNAEPWWQRRRK